MRLLLVEDDAKVAAFVRKGLCEEGFAVDLAASGSDGLELASSGSYDSAVVDLMLPGMDGLTLIDTLRRRKILLPVIILSARRTVAERVEGLHAGGDDYLTKPF